MSAFDAQLERILDDLPEEFRAFLDEIAIVVEDEPSPEILRDLGIDDAHDSDLCGLHSGIPLTERETLGGTGMPDTIYLFRGPIARLAGSGVRSLEKQIRITLLHELGHHFGFDEEKLRALGYE